MEKKKTNIPYVGIGLIFGTALGAGISIALNKPILWAGIGTGVGLIIGAIIESFNKNNKE